MNTIQETVDVAVARQSPLLRFKASFIIIATGLVTILGQLAVSPDIAATKWGTAVTVAATVAAALLNRFTKDGVTPSTAEQLQAAALHVPQDNSTSALVEGARAAELAGLPTANPNDPPLGGEGGGSHRLAH